MIVLLNPLFNCSKSLLSFSADKVTTGTCNFVCMILKVAFVGELSLCSGLVPSAAVNNLCSVLVITQVADQLKAKDTSQLTIGIFRLFQKMPRCFNGTAISTSFVPSLFAT